MPDYTWKPIEDLPADRIELSTGELDALLLVWNEQRTSLESSGRLAEFNQLIDREWSIETGIIEGVYHLDAGTTAVLIERGIDAALIPRGPDTDPVMVAAMIQDHQDVLEGLFSFVKGDRELTVGYINELHAALLRHQEWVRVMDQSTKAMFDRKLEKGRYKMLPNSPNTPDGSLHEYCPPVQTASEMDRLIELHREHTQARVEPEIEAAWLHHAFTQIHPFEDGNGRVARAIATAVFLKVGWFPLVISRNDAGYLDALRIADRGDLKPLIALFTAVQKRYLAKAMDVADQVKPVQTIDEAVAAAARRLVLKGAIIPKEWNRARDMVPQFIRDGEEQLNVVVNKLNSEIGRLKQGFLFQVGTTDDKKWEAPLDIARQLHYVANLTYFHTSLLLKLNTTRPFDLVVSFHGLGATFRGLLAVSVFLHWAGEPPVPASNDFFQINYKEDVNQAKKRFHPWLESAIAKGLSLWAERI